MRVRMAADDHYGRAGITAPHLLLLMLLLG
jgi:hypothetical protein